MQSVVVSKNQAEQRLDKFLRKCLPEAGSGFLYKMLRKKNIVLNGKKAEGWEKLSVGDEITFFFSDETFAKFSGKGAEISLPEKDFHTRQTNVSGICRSEGASRVAGTYLQAYRTLADISVLYEDDNVLILNKPVGILTQKAAPCDISLNEWLVGYLLECGRITEEELLTFHPSVCNRLDRNTSGIVLCGKSLAGSQALSRIIKERTIRKLYRTICVGELKEDAFLSGYLYKSERTNKVTVCKEIPDASSPKDFSLIKTSYHPIVWEAGFTLLEVELITGKTHQIRSHLSDSGHPIIGDGKYGSQKVNRRFRERNSLHNQLLHAYRIVFPAENDILAPLSGCEIIAPCPEQFERIERELFPEFKEERQD